ncbi:unnamed protein product [Symbiodinium sp. KB8]|nr:unnamed protein product [Symbiodinium sp. KB8]
MLQLSPKTGVLYTLVSGIFGCICTFAALLDSHWGSMTFGPDRTVSRYGLWQVCTKATGDSSFQCQDITAEDVNSNLNAARTFAIFTFLAALLIVYAAVQAWRQAGAHPFPKLAFIASLLNVLFIIVTVGAYANWFAYEVVHDEQKVGNSTTAHWIGSFVLTTLVLFLYLSIAAVVFLTFGAAGSWGNGASSQQHVKLDEESGASSAASSATYAGVVGDSSV